jgi:hypothetical protein
MEETLAQRPTTYFSKQRKILSFAFETLGDWVHPDLPVFFSSKNSYNTWEFSVLSGLFFTPPKQRSLISTLPSRKMTRQCSKSCSQLEATLADSTT